MGENAEEIYESVYAPVFKAHSKLKGIVFVGESVQFPSQDERTTGRTHREFLNKDNLPDPKPAPGWWPCKDYPEWISLVQKVIKKYKPDADIVFWTYNWGWAPEKERIELLEKLPEYEFLTSEALRSLVTPVYQVGLVVAVIKSGLKVGIESSSSVGFASSPEGYARISALATARPGATRTGSQQATS